MKKKISSNDLQKNELDGFIMMRINQLREEGARELKRYSDFEFKYNENFMQYKLLG